MLARSSQVFAYQLAIIAIAVSLSVANRSFAQPMGGGPQMGPPAGPQMGPPQGGGNDWPAYQRKGFNGGPGNGNWRGGGYGYYPQQTSGSYFTRPYPYHLDYYKMRYGGSYAPYYGNLYGQSNSFYPAQYNGDYGPGNPDPNKAEPNGPPSEYPTNASGGGHWAWCWVPDGSDGTSPVYSAPPIESLPSQVSNQSSATAPALKPATGTATHTSSLP